MTTSDFFMTGESIWCKDAGMAPKDAALIATVVLLVRQYAHP